jgi:triacylglycerol lipase
MHFYWGRIPAALRKNGAVVFFGNQDGNATVQENARQLLTVIQCILAETGAEKINIIAHSKGGLEARYLVSAMGLGDRIASVTTLSTPHNGSLTVDWLMRHFSSVIRAGCVAADLCRRLSGDRHPCTYRAIEQFTTDCMQQFNREFPDDSRVFYQSYAFVMHSSFSDVFLALAHAIVRHFEGENDGLLTPANARWTNFRGIYTGTTRRGISHADVTDYRRFRFTKKQPPQAHSISDMSLFYVQLAADLKERGF